MYHHLYYHDTLGHMIASSLIHAVIYGAIWNVMRHLTLPEDLAVAAAVIGGVVLLSRTSSRRW
jgi:hypothetical protein